MSNHRILGLVAFLATGCVSQQAYDDLKQHDKELAFKLSAAEHQCLKLDAEKKVVQRELDGAKDEAKLLREKEQFARDSVTEVRNEVRKDAEAELQARLDAELKARLAELQAKAPSKQELSPWGGVVLESGILFAPGHHALTKQGEDALAPLVESLMSDKYDGFQVELSGHTDSDPVKATAKVYQDNHELAAKRANSVRRFLVGKGVPPTRIWLSAWGETRPLASESSPSDKAKNRRVEIRLHRTDSELPAGAKPGTDTTKAASTPKEPEKKDEPKTEKTEKLEEKTEKVETTQIEADKDEEDKESE